ncbi:hypothetical protein UG55_105111 [Frankia sp. EI5c]|nr:hypothetical protein UG55_105111 [Frankia sp. EI5c]
MQRLAFVRASATFTGHHPNLRFSLLHWVVDGWHDSLLREIFYAGLAILSRRFMNFGLLGTLPVDRVWVGIRSSDPSSFGGFHYPQQGYRHIQLGAVVTSYGQLAASGREQAALTALDLLRTYAHDCLHYASYRVYTLHNDTLTRVRYGLNRRDLNGSPYSARDRPGSRTTRNLGIVTEGAVDREARAIARQVAATYKLRAEHTGFDGLVFRDATGQLSDTDRTGLASLTEPAGAANQHRYLAAMASYERVVNARYQAFLAEIGGSDQEELHDAIIRGTLSGDRSEVYAWLEGRHGPNAFEELFRANTD